MPISRQGSLALKVPGSDPSSVMRSMIEVVSPYRKSGRGMVSSGDTADPSTLSAQIEKAKDRFGINRAVVVGDRGMINSARIRD
jgi:hypothetical protein